jgi:proteic killer suppression protein
MRRGKVIGSFGDKETEQLWQRKKSRKLPADIQRTALRKLEELNAATTLQDLRTTPAYRLEALAGKRKGQYSIRINDQWRICFKWNRGKATNVEITDYH